MKKLISTCLIVLLLLNVMGYYGLFLGLHHRNTIEQQERFNAENYKESETITIKLPIAIPYFGDTEFERVDGEIEYKGQFYRLIKQKFEQDTVRIVCIRDVKGKQINDALTEYVKTFSDHAAERSNAKLIFSFIKDFTIKDFDLESLTEGWSISLTYNLNDDSIFHHFGSISSPPPRS